jgi:hypothetical protein
MGARWVGLPNSCHVRVKEKSARTHTLHVQPLLADGAPTLRRQRMPNRWFPTRSPPLDAGLLVTHDNALPPIHPHHACMNVVYEKKRVPMHARLGTSECCRGEHSRALGVDPRHKHRHHGDRPCCRREPHHLVRWSPRKRRREGEQVSRGVLWLGDQLHTSRKCEVKIE